MADPQPPYDGEEEPTGRVLHAAQRAIVYEVLYSLDAEARTGAVRMLARWLALDADGRVLADALLARLKPRP
jgi:hypothetical protein